MICKFFLYIYIYIYSVEFNCAYLDITGHLLFYVVFRDISPIMQIRWYAYGLLITLEHHLNTRQKSN